MHSGARLFAACLVLVVSPSIGNDEFTVTILEKSLGLKPEIGHISDSGALKAGELPEFILIQDIHKHPEVQEHIAEAIVQAYRAWGVKKVFMEGAVSAVDLTMFHRVPDRTRMLLLQSMIKDGDLSGPELAAILLMESEWRNPPSSPFQLIGMEDAQLYRQNLMTYQQVLSLKERSLYELQRIRRLQTSMDIGNSNILAKQLDRTEALIRLKLTPNEYDAYWSSKSTVPSSPSLTPMINAAEKFYQLVILRSHAFLVESRKKVPAGPGPRILVAGGFHTAFMASELRKGGHSYIVVTPHVTESGYQDLYERHMQDSIQALQLVAKAQ